MPPKQRPPNITTLTGQRKVMCQRLKASAHRVERYCGTAGNAPAVQVPPVVLAGDRATRSSSRKELFVLEVPECTVCNGRNVEMFDHEYERVLVQFPTRCDHQKQIANIGALGAVAAEAVVPPPITIPAIGRQRVPR